MGVKRPVNHRDSFRYGELSNHKVTGWAPLFPQPQTAASLSRSIVNTVCNKCHIAQQLKITIVNSRITLSHSFLHIRFLIFKQSVLNESCEIHRVIMEMVVVLSLPIMYLQWLSIRLQTHLSVSLCVGGGGVGRWGV